MGRNIEINSSDVVTQDHLRQHSEKSSLNFISRIEAEDSLFMRVYKLNNKGYIISTNGIDDILANTFIENEGGTIVSKKGGQIKAQQRFTNKSLINQLTVDVGKREDAPQDYNTRVTFNICAEPGMIGTSKSKITTNEEGVYVQEPDELLIQAPLVQNISSFLINGNGT
ncbi:MAG: hypothetical protein EZS28_045101, partial [Streblomastix strix]